MPVYFFFLISGYVISLTLNNVATMREFIVFRFARLFPAFWAAVCLTTVVLFCFPCVGEAPTGAAFAANLTMLHGLAGIRSIDPVYWSLSFELIFYGLIAIVFSAIRYSPSKLALFAVLWLALSAGASAFFPGAFTTSAFASHLFEYTPFFTGGIAFYFWRNGERRALIAGLALASLGLAATRIPVFGAASATALFGLFCLVAANRARWLANPVMLYLGRISYPLYLFHLAPGFLLVGVFEAVGAPWPIGVAAAIAVLIGAAHVIHERVEAPARRSIRRLARGGATVALAAAKS